MTTVIRTETPGNRGVVSEPGKRVAFIATSPTAPAKVRRQVEPQGGVLESPEGALELMRGDMSEKSGGIFWVARIRIRKPATQSSLLNV